MRVPRLALPSLAAALLVTLAGCGGDSPAGPSSAGPVARVIVTGGDLQRGPAGGELPVPLAVKVVDAAGRPVPSAVVSFVVVRGGGSVFAGASSSNAQGIAKERWTLGTTAADSQRVEVRGVDNTTGQGIVYAAFTAAAVAAAPATVAVLAGGAQSAPAGTAVPVAPSVRVTDRFGNAAVGAPVGFSVTAGGGALTGASAVTDSAGVASLGSWTLGPVAAVPNALAVTSGAATAAVVATATSPLHVVVVSPAANAAAGDPLTVSVSATTVAAGGAIASVSAAVDGRTTPLAYDAATQRWSAQVPMSASATGGKMLTVTALDRAGNSAVAVAPFQYLASYGPTLLPSASYVRLQSAAGDYVGGGRTYSYAKANAVMSATVSGNHFVLGINGDQWWTGDFQLPSSIAQLRTGTWSNVQRYPFHNPALGGMDWSGDGRGCNTLVGTFTIDTVSVVAGALVGIDLTFDQHCEGAAPALHGVIHWRANDPTSVGGPTLPIPAGLWQPPAGALPASGDYVYLASDAGDYIGGGVTTTYTAPGAPLSVSASGGHVSITVGGWYGDLQTMNSISQLQPGYYPALQRYPFHNPALGGFDWSGNGRGCNTLSAWFVVDRVSYSGSTITGLDARFEQHCEGQAPALHGAIHWGT